MVLSSAGDIYENGGKIKMGKMVGIVLGAQLALIILMVIPIVVIHIKDTRKEKKDKKK